MLWSFKMYLRLMAIQLRSQMQYRMSFWFELVSTGIMNGVYILSLVFILERFGNIGGWTMSEIAFLAGMIEMSFGTMDMIFSGYDPDFFAKYVRNGTFDQVLLRPVNVFWQVMGSSFLLRRLGRILEGVIIFLIALSLLDIQWTTAKILYLPVVFVSQVLTMGALFIIGSTINFWTVERLEAFNILTYGSTDLVSYPMHIYPVWMQKVYTFLFPFIFLNYYPALFFLEKPDPLHLPPFAPFMAPVVALVFFAAAMRFWQFGINHYQSTGS